MNLWSFATQLYDEPGVSSACIGLQERHAVNVNLLIFSAWIGFHHGLPMLPQHLNAIQAKVQAWQEHVVVPLRKIRMRMKESSISSFHPGSVLLRAEVKALELQSEKLMLESLEGWATTTFARRTEPRAGVEQALDNLCRYLQAHMKAHQFLGMQMQVAVPIPAVEIEPVAIEALHRGLERLALRLGRS